MFRLLQLADSAFPTGGFAHSGGLEAAVQLGEVREVEGFVEEALIHAAHSMLPFVEDAYCAHETLGDVDNRAEAFLLSHVARRASRVQGRALAATAAKTFGEMGLLQEWNRQVRAGVLHGHVGPMTGAVSAAVGLSLSEGLTLALHIAARGILSAAVRLGKVGPLEAQAIQARIPFARLLLMVPAEPVSTAPILDIFGAVHDRLYSRLFQS